jgi:hypothetical protein
MPDDPCEDYCNLPAWYLNAMKKFESNYGYPVEVKENKK